MDRGSYQAYGMRYGASPKKASALRIADRALAVLVAALFVGGAIYLARMGSAKLVGYIVVPALSFVVMSIMRIIINRPRPAEVLNFTPVLGRHGKGRSFPSRHVFSAFVIACALYWVWLPLALVCVVAGCCLAYIRVVGGLHWPSDVIMGAVLGLIFGIGGYLIMYI